ncbi:MAG TPA: hypothetical protein VGM90_19095 [Kofleriaceae bacterium]
MVDRLGWSAQDLALDEERDPLEVELAEGPSASEPQSIEAHARETAGVLEELVDRAFE